MLEALPSCCLESTGKQRSRESKHPFSVVSMVCMGVGEGGLDEMQNKTEAQPASLQLAAVAPAGALLSLAKLGQRWVISFSIKNMS